MQKDIVVKLHNRFEGIARSDADGRIEYWHARDLPEVLGYAEWRKFVGSFRGP